MGARARRQASLSRSLIALGAAAVLVAGLRRRPGTVRRRAHRLRPAHRPPTSDGRGRGIASVDPGDGSAAEVAARCPGRRRSGRGRDGRPAGALRAGDARRLRHPRAAACQRGAQLAVLGGPVEASGYTWYRVAPLDVRLEDGVTEGWVAAADPRRHAVGEPGRRPDPRLRARRGHGHRVDPSAGRPRRRGTVGQRLRTRAVPRARAGSRARG